MALNLRSLTRVATSPYGTAPAKVNFYAYASADAMATILAPGYFNNARDILKANDIIQVVALATGAGDHAQVKMASVPSSGNVLVEMANGGEVGGEARAVVPTADGLTTGLLLAADTYVSVASADANHILTLPAIADVPLGKEIWGKNGATACEMRTPATSNTTINNTDADSTEAVIAANVSFMVKKTSTTNWALLTLTGGAVAAPTPD